MKIAEQLLLVPFFLTSWGAAYYGEWLTLTIIPSVLAFSDLGFGSAASNAFVLAYASGDKDKASNIFKTGLYITSGTVVLGILLSLCIMLFAYYTGLLNKSLIPAYDSIVALILLMATRLINFYGQIIEALFRAKRRAATSTNLQTLLGLINISVGIIVLRLGGNIIAYSTSLFIVGVLFIISYGVYGCLLVKHALSGVYKKSEAQEIFGKGFGFMMTPIWQSIYFQGSTFVVRIVLGAEAVAVFNTVRTVCRSINQVYSIVSNSVFPELQYAIGEKDYEKAKRIFVLSVQLVFLCSVLGVFFLSTAGQTLYAWWTRNQLIVDDKVWLIFMIGIFFNALWWTSAGVFRAVNQPYRFAMYGVVCASLSTLISYVLSYQLGIMGATIGYVLMDILMSLLVLPNSCKILKVSISELLSFRLKKSRYI